MKRKKNILLTLENDIDEIISSLRNERVSFMVVDSIQTVFSSDLGSSPGSISQVKNVTMKTIDFAKKRGVPVLLVGHVTKEGEIAGPKLVEHMVDTVAYFEGDRRTGLRLLKITKNRFGPSDEVAVFELKENGFVQVENPSFTEGDADLPGNVLTCVFEGTKPFVVQIQALVSKNRTFSPKRVCKGVDVNRVMLLIAVISKYLKFPIETHDVYVNVVGGLRITDPAADLAIALSIVSSYLEVSLHDTAAVGEIGLDGRVRKVYNINRRLNSLKNSGRIIVPPIEEEKKGVFVVCDLKEAVFIIGGEILGTPGID